jgi:plasmid stabilization system protein ParE
MCDLDELAVYIAVDNDRAADFVEARVRAEAKLLSRFPRSGRPGRIPGIRERVVGRTPYILAYRIVSGGSAFFASITEPVNGP